VSNRGESPRDLLPRLFDPFVEAPNSGRHGLGLGLYIVQQIARAHGGKVSAESSNGTTTMKVALPRRAQSRSNPL
jgi:signal transduction histidine kinase